MACQFWLSVDYTASSASIFNLFILSLDRYWSITSPLKYLRQRTKKRALIMIALAWTSALMWIVPILGWRFFVYGGKHRWQGKNYMDHIFQRASNDLKLNGNEVIFWSMVLRPVM